MKILAFPVTVLFLVLAGCSAETVYNSLQSAQEMECSKLPRSDQEECYRRAGMSYDEYQRQLKEHPAKQ
jgi:hypothetical protein